MSRVQAGYQWRWNLWLTLALSSLSAVAQRTVLEKTAQPPIPCVRVVYYDYARTPASVIIEGMNTAERIFDQAGVRVTASEVRSDSNEPPSGSRRDHTPVLYLRILPDSMANRLEQRFEAIGSAYPTDDNSGQIASVFYDRLQGLPASATCSRGTMLGHVIAHELGHLLLGRNSHSESGIMSANWQRDNQIVRIRTGALLFRPEEGERIRRNVSERQRLLSVTSDIPH